MGGTSTKEPREEYTVENGFILSECYVPEEILIQILSFVDLKTLIIGLSFLDSELSTEKRLLPISFTNPRCRSVCKNWREIVQSLVLRYKAEQEGIIYFKDTSNVFQKLTWVDFYWIIKKKPFGRNILKNNCGQDNLAGWDVITSGGDGWIVENKPQGTDSLPVVDAEGGVSPDFGGFSSCFASSYNSCRKQQLIDLRSEGLTANIMDKLQPPIEISEWTACRFDCGSVYELKVSLLDQKMKIIKKVSFKENFSQSQKFLWKKVSHIFTEYGSGVRYILFYHSGKDSQVWDGHYGSKMSGGIVRINTKVTEKLPSIASVSSTSLSL